MYDTCASEDMDPPVLGSRILTRLIILYVMGFNSFDYAVPCNAYIEGPSWFI